MLQTISRYTTVFLSVFIINLSGPAFADEAEFLAYVEACKTQLGFAEIPRIFCDDEQFRVAFSGGHLGLDFSQSNDFVAHAKVTDQVDAVFACRWVGQRDMVGQSALRGEMIVHRRDTGDTCFFELQQENINRFYPTVPVSPVSVTDANAADVWEVPRTVCTQCHNAGPYIASPQIAPALAKFGLMNDRHDIKNEKYKAIGPPGFPMVQEFNNQLAFSHQPSCAIGCHTMRGDPVVPSIDFVDFVSGVALPSIHHVIEDILQMGNQMPPNDRFSPYRWVNLDIPDQLGTGDWETYLQVEQYNSRFADCSMPEYMTVREVGSDDVLSTNTFPDVLQHFNAQQGLQCLNSDNDPQRCSNYAVRFTCENLDGSTYQTSWIDADNPAFNSTGDNEVPPANCNATRIEATRVQDANGNQVNQYAVGFPDVIDRFTESGFVCLNADQNDTQCENYTVQFVCPTYDRGYATIINPQTNRVLTETYPLNSNDQRDDQNGVRKLRGQPLSAENWASQDLVIEPIGSSKYVRIRSRWTHNYINISTTNEGQEVNLTRLEPQWWSQQWEKIGFFNGFILKNRWSGKYLTMENYSSNPDFLKVTSRDISFSNFQSQVFKEVY